ncbi:unnamed protein product [marine sediment metagenome]|uniref:Phage replisome organiser N-terminal domain-containing protein n=1 Tax=marine sediment metagenome TaxID=412755 RepID=X1EQD3_9ZZZZ
MARGRMIDKVIILSQKINTVSEGAENLYYRIYVNTDDFGLFHADPEILKGLVYTLRKISIETIENRLDELIKIELIKIYKHNNETYLEIVDFEDHQTFRKDYKRKREYPKPNTKSYEPVQSRTESPTNINEIKLKETKLNEEDTKIITLLSKVKNYPFNKEEDLKFIQALKVEFPDVDILEKVKQVTINWLKFPLTKKSRPRVQIRRWVTNEQKWQKEGERGKRVGESTHTPSKKEDDYVKARAIKMKELQEKYQPEIDKAMKAKSSDWMDEIDNKIKEGIAEFSREYHKDEE